MIRIFLIGLSLFCCVAAGATEPAHNDLSIISDCDRLAGSTSDKDRIGPGVEFTDLEQHAEEAIAACEHEIVLNAVPRIYYQLGRAYDAAKRFADAKRNYEIAIKSNYADAENALGYLYVMGQGGKRDRYKAYHLFLEAAQAGHVGAQNNLGAMYGRGWVVERDKEKAIYWYTKAAAQGDKLAKKNLRTIRRGGSRRRRTTRQRRNQGPDYDRMTREMMDNHICHTQGRC